MKTIKMGLIVAILLALSISCSKDPFITDYHPNPDEFGSNSDHPMKDSLQFIIDKYVGKGIPGVQVVVKNDNGWLHVTGGYAKVESRSPFKPGGISWLFSITKTYTAALVMKQIEKNTINPDHFIIDYLPESTLSNVEGSEKITVRMLLNHTSGIVNVTELPEFVVGQLNDPLNQPSVAERLAMVKGKPLVFDPGTDFMYSNPNYLLLQLLLENVTGKSYEHLLKSEIFQPLSLEHTYYKVYGQKAVNLGLPNYYFDRYANEQLENITAWNNALANASDGYGGIAATPSDAVKFYEALLNGKVVSANSLQEMKTWVRGKTSTEPEYGEGFEYWQFNEGSTPQFGHEGDGIGCSTQMFYVPDNHTILYINVNVGRQIFGPYLFKITDMKRELCRYVANWSE